MGYFTIVIYGRIPQMEGLKLFVEVARSDAYFREIEDKSFIYGYATEQAAQRLYELAKETGFKVEMEKGD